MFSVLGLRIRAQVTRVVTRIRTALYEATRPCQLALGALKDLSRSRSGLIAENALLRQQLIVASRRVKRPEFKPHERGLLVLLSRCVRGWRDALLLVKPDTILRWHRQGFRLFWRWKSGRPKVTKQHIADHVIALIRQMAEENLWGAERIRGELLKLGIRVAKRTIQRYMRAVRRPNSPRGQSWKTFLCNHTVWACDFLLVYDIWFRPLFALFFVDINSREVIHVATTRAPTEQWTAQQLRNITPFGHGPEVIIRDRDQKYGVLFDRVAEGAGIEVSVTAPRTPTMNATCERFLGSARRECLDHIMILGERHLRQVLQEYCLRYFNTARPHQRIGQRIPLARHTGTSDSTGKIIAFPVLNGLHHDYRRVA